MRRGFTRREAIAGAAKIGAAVAALRSLSVRPVAPAAAASPLFNQGQRRTLSAALARMIPAEGPGDWSAADAGAGRYIEHLLSGNGDVYAGGPTRKRFRPFRPLSRAKEMGWAREVHRLRTLYAEGLAELDARAGGSFAGAPTPRQDLVLESLDLEGSAFFAALYAHTMEGVYSHPVYGGNTGYRAWRDLCYQGDVHGVRFPKRGSRGSWNRYGGYAPEEMASPGACPGQGPAT